MAKTDVVKYLNCCDRPALLTVKGIYLSNHDAEALRRCESCGAYWFYRYLEYVTFATEDDWTVWYSPLSPTEAELLLAAEDRPNLAFLERRASFMEDREGVRQVPGQPTDPWS